MIRLERISKRYPGQSADAVAELNLDVKQGEIVVLVGPSGCGKTTTLRMINRLVQPSQGRIYLDGEDVTQIDATRLRRRIGYVIQQVGLFPHMTVGRNVGLIPKILGQDGQQIAERVDELLALVGLNPDQYRERYPRELSGGQQQRVGVARALAADPPVMLMDEPFGAIDPITRERLQDEFLSLQQRIGKTIVFVTHDIQEAIKLGDRIAIFGPDSTIAQYDTPERILAHPADDFVRSFVGAGAAVRSLGLLHLRDLPLPACERVEDRRTISEDATLYDALDAMLQAGVDELAVAGAGDAPPRLLRWADAIRARERAATGSERAATGSARSGEAP
ncbi:MAG: ATP-binding cassette domain-containing protein [Micromonosporaceae bacterium]|nr:ATP-binding cassette domain-containing protein [Micromonosporaceae bacterium]